MATLDATKYPNNIRTITGAVNAVLQDDVVLLCDTSGGAVNIQLPELPENHWSVTWRIYVYDISGNAAANNITIEAPAGYKVNNQATLVISENGGGCMVRILDNTNFITSLNSTITPTTGFVALTVAELQALIDAGTVSEGTYYRVTDANLCDLGAIVQGTSTTTVSLAGSGLFLVADYLNVSGNNVGVWNLAMPPLTAGVSICIWDGLMYLSLDGVVGLTPVEAEHWQLITKSVANGYILECDDIRYDPYISAGVDRLMYRADKRQNEVEYAIYKGQNALERFQWGNYDPNNPAGAVGAYGNKVLSGSFLGIINQSTRAKTFYNTLSGESAVEAETNQGWIVDNELNGGCILIATSQSGFIQQNTLKNAGVVTLSTQGATGQFNRNTVQDGGSIDIATNNSFIEDNFVHTAGSIQVNQNDSRLDRNEVGAGYNVQLVTPNLTAYADKKAVSGRSTFDYTLDLSDPTIYNNISGLLTIAAALDWVGYFFLSNSNVIVNGIANLPTRHDVTFITATNGEVTTFVTVAVLGAPADALIAAQAVGAIQMTGRTNGTDDIVIRKNGNLNAVVGRPNQYL